MKFRTLSWSRLALACIPVLVLAGASVAFVACSSSDYVGMTAQNGDATVRVSLTDAPSDYVASAEVTISSVQLVPGDDSTEFVELLDVDEGPLTFDLIDLQNGVTALLAERPVPPGNYEQLRLIVDDAQVTLIDGYRFNDGSSTQTLFVPSGMQTGIKVETTEPIEATEGMLIAMVVDFDVDRSFVIQGNPETPAGIHGMLFTPHLKEVERVRQAM